MLEDLEAEHSVESLRGKWKCSYVAERVKATIVPFRLSDCKVNAHISHIGEEVAILALPCARVKYSNSTTQRRACLLYELEESIAVHFNSALDPLGKPARKDAFPLYRHFGSM